MDVKEETHALENLVSDEENVIGPFKVMSVEKNEDMCDITIMHHDLLLGPTSVKLLTSKRQLDEIIRLYNGFRK